MKRRLVTLAAVASLVLCIATVVLWVRSYSFADHLAWGHFRYGAELPSNSHPLYDEFAWRGIEMRSECGGMRLLVWSAWAKNCGISPVWSGWKLGREGSQSYPYFGAAEQVQIDFWGWGFQILVEHTPTAPSFGYRQCVFIVPQWLIIAIALIGPSMWAVRFCRAGHKSLAAQACEHCGYDLRATPQRCPECGGVPASAVGCVPP